MQLRPAFDERLRDEYVGSASERPEAEADPLAVQERVHLGGHAFLFLGREAATLA